MSDKYKQNYCDLVKTTEYVQYSEQGVRDFCDFINETQDPICVCGSGTSYIVAEGIAKIINQLTGIITFAKRPRDFIYYNKEKIKRMLFISFSNNRVEYEQIKVKVCNSCILSYYPDYKVNDDNILMVKETEMLRNMKFYFNNPQAVVIPLEFVYFCLSNNKINTFSYWKEKLRAVKIVDFSKVAVFYGDNCECAAKDLKNKFEESMLGCVDIYEKRDFSHGKFLSFNAQVYSMILYFRQNQDSEYEDLLLNYLNTKHEIILIQSMYSGIEAEIDLLQAEQTLFYKMCISGDVDFGDAYVDEESKKLYSYSNDIR